MIRITACYEKGVELGDDEFLVMMMMMMMICSITNIDPSTIVVQRVLSLDDGSERVDDDDDEFLVMMAMIMII